MISIKVMAILSSGRRSGSKIRFVFSNGFYWWTDLSSSDGFFALGEK